MSYTIYADIESLIRKIDGCVNNPENSSTTKIGEHIPCRYLMPTIWAFDDLENKRTLYHGEDCMKKFCTSLRDHATNVCMKKFYTSLRDHATNVINFEKKKMLPLTKGARMTSRCKSMLYLWKKILKKVC